MSARTATLACALLVLATLLGLTAATALALYRGLEATLEAAPQLYAHPARWSNHANALWIGQELAGRTQPALLFAGSSTTRTAFDEELVEELTGGAYYVENLSNSTTDPVGIYYWLRWLAKHRPAALPDVLVQGIEELELQDDYAYHAFHSHLTHFFADAELFAEDPLFARELESAERRALVALESDYPLYARRALLQGLVVGSVVWPAYAAGVLERGWLSRFHLRPYDWNYFRVAAESTRARREQGLARLAESGNFDPARYRFPTTQSRALRRIAEFCAEHGILHLAVVMPGVPEKFDDELPPALLEAMRRTIAAAYTGTPTRLIEAWHLLRGEDFFDSLHINQHGRGVLTRLVVERLAVDLVERGLDAPYRRRAGGLDITPVVGRERFDAADRGRYAVAADGERRRETGT